MPVNLVAAAESEGRQDWLATLRETVDRLETNWSIHLGEPFQPGGQTAWVAPTVGDNENLVVTIGHQGS